ncbi:MAG TPA: tetratricopeptide repeat protein [Azonexus sp.]|nr:tetratricopeptide repeat protein [Azonexus sp.]
MGESNLLQRTVWRRAASFAGLLMASALVVAGPNEDYAAGFKSYQENDIVGAMTPLRAAANAGHAKAQVLLAEILDRSEFDEDAVALYRKAAEQGDSDGMFGLGAMTASGEGVKKKDPIEGRKWIEKAAELGHKQAISVMAQAYLKGELGLTEADRVTPAALRWVKLAAENDYLPAVDALIAAYSSGNSLGVAPDRALVEQYQAQANRIRNVGTVKTKKKPRRVSPGTE